MQNDPLKYYTCYAKSQKIVLRQRVQQRVEGQRVFEGWCTGRRAVLDEERVLLCHLCESVFAVQWFAERERSISCVLPTMRSMRALIARNCRASNACELCMKPRYAMRVCLECRGGGGGESIELDSVEWGLAELYPDREALSTIARSTSSS